MSIRLIALDIDGTTVDSSGRLTEVTKSTLEEAIRRGVHVVISTGRPFSAVSEELLNIEGIGYAITSNGAHITDIEADRCIYNSCVAESAVLEAIEIAERFGIDLEAFRDGKAYVDESYYRQVEKKGCEYRRKEYVLKTRIPVEDLHAFMRENCTEIENINFYFSELERLEEVRPYIEGIRNATSTSSFRNNLEIGGPHTSKMNAMKYLAEILGIGREEIMCCGDAPNDIAMITYAGIGVAMGNAWDQVKEAADYVTDTNDNDGVAKAVKKFVLDYEITGNR